MLTSDLEWSKVEKEIPTRMTRGWWFFLIIISKLKWKQHRSCFVSRRLNYDLCRMWWEFYWSGIGHIPVFGHRVKLKRAEKWRGVTFSRMDYQTGIELATTKPQVHCVAIGLWYTIYVFDISLFNMCPASHLILRTCLDEGPCVKI